MQLIYHGHCFDYAPAADRPSRQPRAVNWRYQVPGHHPAEPRPVATSFRYRPNAVNWRYRTVVEG